MQRKAAPLWQPALLTVLLVSAILAGCSPLSSIPVTGADRLTVIEYALVEQSTDNPTHAEFIKRVPAAIEARRADWTRTGPETGLKGPNQVLEPLGYRLDANPTPPFSAFALFHGDRLVQDGILHFGPATSLPDGSDFNLTFETLDGQVLVASRAGIQPESEPGSGSQPDGLPQSSLPARLSGERLAYSGSGPIAALDSLADGFIDDPYDSIFGVHTLAGRSFFFYTQDGLAGLHYNGASLGYNYDHIIYNAIGPAAIYNPGANQRVIWFYALRDGLWYYVEASLAR
jgi:hypothetical protein